ncbi:DNA helicase MCM9 isoform X2 [Orussus abietinus]|uniref:DNA helicase MCM9 isoform X2 n=1 Tax=Orussus abietinus TaxID=222816 RepID=UPI0006250EE8|nr:DNA helicase MCM9 isoform X2 [Orussus abietinus]
MLKEYFLKHHLSELKEILDAENEDVYYSIYVNFVSLHHDDADAADKICQHPRHYLPLCDEGAIKAQEELVAKGQSIKKLVRTRIIAIPVGITGYRIGALVCARGTVVRTSQPTVLKLIKRFNCRKCKHVTLAKLEWERKIFPDVMECEACHSHSVSALDTFLNEDCTDYQDIRLQQKRKTDGSSLYTEHLRITLIDDLVDKCRPGDEIDINGVLINRYPTLIVGQRIETTPFLLANSVTIHRKVLDTKFSTQETQDIFEKYWANFKDHPLVGRDKILASICPQLFGLYTVKLALAVVLAGGVSKTNASGMRVRGEPHLLFIGDPGTGKSQMLRTASRLATRSVLTTGIGSTAAGLTAAAIKDGDGWHLEGGALVLADGGVCCVDEFNTMSSHDRASVHEAMEQQTISIAKAGLVSKLNSRCTVIAAMNPIGGYMEEGAELKTRLGIPLLSRFDLILILRDNKNPEWDLLTTRHILKAACEPEEKINKKTAKSHMDLLKSEGLWKEDSLREYLAYVHMLKPSLTLEAEEILRASYLRQRSHPDRKQERTTVSRGTR